MTAEIISFKPVPEEEKHLSGPAHCFKCRHKWVQVAPVGTVFLNCPECGSLSGLFDYPIGPTDDVWECGCGNRLFYVTVGGVMCPACGKEQEFL